MQRESTPFMLVVGSICSFGALVVRWPSLPNEIAARLDGVVVTATDDAAVHPRNLLFDTSTTCHPVVQLPLGFTLTMLLRLIASLRAYSSAEKRSNEAVLMP